jgi:hypothetical protein
MADVFTSFIHEEEAVAKAVQDDGGSPGSLARVLPVGSTTLWLRADESCAGLSGRSFGDGADLVREDRERGRG